MDDAFRHSRVLITGGLGFIGSNLARRLVHLGARVSILDALAPNTGANRFNVADLADRIDLTIGNVCDRPLLGSLVADKDYVFHLAGLTSHLESMRDPLADLDTNCRATLLVLEACREHNPLAKIVCASTRQVYGRPHYLPVDEAHPICPVDVNGIHKAASEGYLEIYQRVHGLHTACLRLTNTIGPGMRIKDGLQNFFGIWVRRVLEGQPVEVWEGDQLRDLCHVDDVVAALLLAIQPACNGRIFNLGGPEPLALATLAETLVAEHGTGSWTVRPFPAARQRIDIGSFYADWSSIKETLGWQPRVSVREGVRRTLAYYRAHLHHYV